MCLRGLCVINPEWSPEPWGLSTFLTGVFIQYVRFLMAGEAVSPKVQETVMMFWCLFLCLKAML